MADTPEVAVARFAANIAMWALLVSGASAAFASGMFYLELRRRLEEGVKLSMSVMADANIIGGHEEDDNTYIAITVTNRGSAPTTLTNMLLLHYPTRLSMWLARIKRPRFLAGWIYRRFKSQRTRNMIVVHPGDWPPPHLLEPGRTWHGKVAHTPKLVAMMRTGRLYVRVSGSHTAKALYRRVRKWDPPKDADSV